MLGARRSSRSASEGNLRVAILETHEDGKSATGVRGSAIRAFLQDQGHEIDVLAPAPGERQAFGRRRLGFWSRVERRVFGRRTLPHLWDHLADRLEPRIRRGHYDAVIGRGQDVGYVMTRGIGGLKILDLANISFLESYYAWDSIPAEVEETFEKETELLRSVDHVLSPHPLLTTMLVEYFDGIPGLAEKTVDVRLGCEPALSHARYAQLPRIVYAGSYYHIQDPYLLAYLTKISPFPIDCYGPTDPNRSFLPANLNYRGYAPQTDFLAEYQFGLITVARDRLRQHSPATKLPYYLSYGLPVLFPEWMKEGHAYPDCAVPYTEETYVARVREACEPARWERLAAAARAAALELTWDKLLRPLASLLKKGATAGILGP